MAKSFKRGSSNMPISDINITPLVDVMLVLVIIFLITAPIMTHKIRIDLPQPNENVKPPENPPEPKKIVIKADGTLYMANRRMTEQQLLGQLRVIGQMPKNKQPEVQIQADDNVQYEFVAKVLSDAKNVDVKKVGFINTN